MKKYIRTSKLQPYNRKTYHIKDIDTDIIVEETTRKEVLGYLEEYLDNLPYDWFDPSDEVFHILYSNGSFDSIDQNYDGHKIAKTGIVAMVYDNPSTSITFGPYEINAYGVVTPAFDTEIDPNIELVGAA